MNQQETPIQELNPGEQRARLLLTWARMSLEELEDTSQPLRFKPLAPWSPGLKECEDDNSNGDKAAEAELRVGWGETDSDNFTNLIADLLHLAYSRGEDPMEIASSAISHFVAETEEEG